jgi:hypothetical protein
MERARRPYVNSSAFSSTPASRCCCNASATAAAVRGLRPPPRNKCGRLVEAEAQNTTPEMSVDRAGGLSTMQLPFAPPMPELVIATMARPFRLGRGVTLVGAHNRYSSHLMAGFGEMRFAVGGMSPVSNIDKTLLSEARNAEISRCLRAGENMVMLTRFDIPYVALRTPDHEIAVAPEKCTSPIGLGWVASACTGRV